MSTEHVATPDKPAAPLNIGNVHETKVEMVLMLRTVLREVTQMNRSPEHERAAWEVEKALNRAITPTLA